MLKNFMLLELRTMRLELRSSWVSRFSVHASNAKATRAGSIINDKKRSALFLKYAIFKHTHKIEFLGVVLNKIY